MYRGCNLQQYLSCNWRRLGVFASLARVAAQGGHRCPDQLIPIYRGSGERYGVGAGRYHSDSNQQRRSTSVPHLELNLAPAPEDMPHTDLALIRAIITALMKSVLPLLPSRAHQNRSGCRIPVLTPPDAQQGAL